jgi:hypothetical protein
LQEHGIITSAGDSDAVQRRAHRLRRWRQAVRAAPLVVDNRVIVATAGPDSGRLFSVAPLNKTVDWTFPLSAEQCAALTEAVPECEPVGPIVGAPAAADGIIYFGTSGIGEGFLYAIDAATGQQVCRSVGLGSIEVNPVVVDGVVYALTTTGQLYAFAVPSCSTPAPNRNTLYYDVSGAGAAPAVSGDLMIIPVGSQVLFVDLPTDTILFNFDAGSAVRSAPVIAGGIVYFGNEAGKVLPSISRPPRRCGAGRRAVRSGRLLRFSPGSCWSPAPIPASTPSAGPESSELPAVPPPGTHTSQSLHKRFPVRSHLPPMLRGMRRGIQTNLAWIVAVLALLVTGCGKADGGPNADPTSATSAGRS